MACPGVSADLRALTAGDGEAAAALIRRAFAAQPVQTDPPSSALRETAENSDSEKPWRL